MSKSKTIIMKKLQYLRIAAPLKPIKFEGIDLSKIEPIKMKDVIYLEFPEGSTQSIFPFTDMYKSCETIEIPDINSELLINTDVKKFQSLGWNVVRTIVLFIAFISSTLNAQESITDEWNFERDKQVHTATGSIIGSGLTTLMYQSNLGYERWEIILVPQIPMAFIGLAKEGIDHSFRGGFVSEQDLIFNQIGCLIGSFVALGVNELIDNRKKDKDKDKLKL